MLESMLPRWLKPVGMPPIGLWAWARYPNYGGEIIMWCSFCACPSELLVQICLGPG